MLSDGFPHTATGETLKGLGAARPAWVDAQGTPAPAKTIATRIPNSTADPDARTVRLTWACD